MAAKTFEMLGFNGAMVVCPATEQSADWVRIYLKDCVCNVRDKISLSLGLVSVVTWGLAEVPQIITNFKEKSTEGVSLTFLMTWVVGDIFNVSGCILEPSTLPTQLYMAGLYTFTTIILVWQTIYYDYLYLYFHPELKVADNVVDPQKQARTDVEAQRLSEPQSIGSGTTPSMPIEASPSSIIRVPHGPHGRRTSRSDLFYKSARSLTSSYTPPMGSYLVGSRESGPQNQGLLKSSFPSGLGTEHSSGSPGSGRGSLAATVAGSVLLVGTVGLSANHVSAGGSLESASLAGRRVLLAGRSLLQTRGRGLRDGTILAFPKRRFFVEQESSGPAGEILGWLMASIYMGGRLPQIWLNIKRGTVEGLSPFMFVFALIGNATYMGSILVRNTDWDTLKHNMPWLVDAAVCVLLDIVILLQFVYFAVKSKNVLSSKNRVEDEKGQYEAIS